MPDIVLATRQGTVFTTKATKIAEHGGFDTQERRVALMVSGAGIPTRQIMDRVYTMQVCSQRNFAAVSKGCSTCLHVHMASRRFPMFLLSSFVFVDWLLRCYE